VIGRFGEFVEIESASLGVNLSGHVKAGVKFVDSPIRSDVYALGNVKAKTVKRDVEKAFPFNGVFGKRPDKVDTKSGSDQFAVFVFDLEHSRSGDA
jgi:hypothetical protein